MITQPTEVYVVVIISCSNNKVFKFYDESHDEYLKNHLLDEEQIKFDLWLGKVKPSHCYNFSDLSFLMTTIFNEYIQLHAVIFMQQLLHTYIFT